MSGFASIASSAESIRRYVQNGMDLTFPDDTVNVIIDSPKKIQEDSRSDSRLLSLFFYKITENADLKNNYPVISRDNKENSSIALDLFFIATPYGPDQDSILRIAGRTQQLLCSSVISGSHLESTLEGTDQCIKITQLPFTQDLISQIWQALEISMRMAFYYIATPVYIELGTKDSAQPVTERHLDRP